MAGSSEGGTGEFGEAREERRGGAAALALVLGLGGCCFITFADHWYSTVVLTNPGHNELTTHALTPVVFFLVFLIVLVLNPILHVAAPSLKLRTRDLMTIFAMWLIAGAISYLSLGNPIMTLIGVFKGRAIQNPVLTQTGFKEFLRPELFLNPLASDVFYDGLSAGDRHVALSAVPWREWAGPLAFWGPFMLVVVVFSSSVVRMVHRQWSKHELLAYPIADVAEYVIGERPGRAFPALFYQKIFWVGFAAVSFIYVVNGLSEWFPLVPSFRLGYWYSDLIREFPFLAKYCPNFVFSFFRWLVHPYMIALAVLLPSDVSLTCWLGWILMLVGAGFYFVLTGDGITLSSTSSIHSGMYVGILGFVLVVGWREYARIAWYAATLRRVEDPELRQAVAACRVFVLAFAGLVLLLMYAGLNWLNALAITAGFGLIVIVMARVTAEIGIPYLLNFWSMGWFVPWKMFGPAFFGPKGLAVMAVVGGVLDTLPANTVAANETTCRKLQERGGRKLFGARFNVTIFLAACVAMGSMVFAHLWNDYSFGGQNERYTCVVLYRFSWNKAAADIQRLHLESKRQARTLDGASAREKLGNIKAATGFWRYFLYGAALVGFCGFMRLRFSWWPFHPLPLLFFNTWVMSRFYVSFLLGWVIKVGLAKVGGGQVYARSKPFFVGVILGQLVTSCVWVAIGAVYYMITGIVPPTAVNFL